ncbi:hypothetical protein BGX27_004040, partial [Mortierella sp. AM989]
TTGPVARTPAATGALLPIAFLKSIPLPQSRPSHASLQLKDCSKVSSEIQHVEKENAYTTSLSPLLSNATRRRPRSKGMSSNLNAAADSYLRAINRSHPLLSSEGNTSGVGRQGITIEGVNGSSVKNGNAFQRSTPFQLLLVNRRLANMVVQLLWGATVFHGHDVSQVESLISTLYKNDCIESPSEKFEVLDCEHETCTTKPCATADTTDLGVTFQTRSSFTMQRGSTRTTQCHHLVHVGNSRSQPHINKLECFQDFPPVKEIGAYQRVNEHCMTSVKEGSTSVRDESSCQKYSDMEVISHRPQCIIGAEFPYDTFTKGTTSGSTSSGDGALWYYHQLVKRIVLNFAHPQASPQLLVRTLECIGSRCREQIQAFDLHANEKMQAAGLETPSELDRLFGLGFSKLRYLRLQGGLVDNQLLGALIKGLSVPSMTSCRLSQVFLGPGSITDSAIDKLIAAAGHCLEVFVVTSCVDVGGGALANLLTKCPKLRVLSVHRSLAKDKELLEGLGIEIKDNPPSSSSQSASTIPDSHSASTKLIIAPLERLELGTVKLTEVGVAEIVRGTCLTLQFLVLEMQHFKEDFLKCTIAPLCKRLKGLCFVEPDLAPQQQWQQGSIQVLGHGEQRPRRRLFDFRRARRTLEIQQQQHYQLRHHGLQSPDRQMTGRHWQQGYDLSRANTGRSPWLGETSTEEWVQYGNCALWATSTIGSVITPRNGGDWGNGNADAGDPLIIQSRARSFSVYFRAISRRLVSMLSTSHAGTNEDGLDQAIAPAEPEDPTANTTGSQTSSIAGNNYENLLERFGVNSRTIEDVLLSLQPSLRVFTAMQTDMIQARLERLVEDAPNISDSIITLSREADQRDKLETFLKLIVLLGTLVFGAAVSINAA